VHCRFASPLGPASPCTRHCNTRVTQDVECITDLPWTSPPHTCACGTRLPPPKEDRESRGRVSPIVGINQKITPLASGGHAQLLTRSPPVFNNSLSAVAHLRLYPGIFRVLNRIKPHVPGYVWDSANSFKFHSCGHTLQETRRLCFHLGPARGLQPTHTASQQRLWRRLPRSLIVFSIYALILGRRASPRWALSPPVVLAGSANSTSRQPILPPSNFSLLAHARGRGNGDCADTLRFPLGIAASWALRFKRGPPSYGRSARTLPPERAFRTPAGQESLITVTI